VRWLVVSLRLEELLRVQVSSMLGYYSSIGDHVLSANRNLCGIATPTVDAQLALDCLNSASLHAKEALALIESILPYVEWQSGEPITQAEEFRLHPPWLPITHYHSRYH
jgi:hypothetical protein